MNTEHKNQIRLAFSEALSKLYQQEVPLYSQLLTLVTQVNNKSELKNSSLLNPTHERHGAIRIGKASELFNLRRLFALMNMQPVAYYDLSASGLPVHSTAFRPIDVNDLAFNPFRIFTSLLRLDLIKNPSLQKIVHQTLGKRDLFCCELLELMNHGEINEQFDTEEFSRFIKLSIDIFKWHKDAAVEFDIYKNLKASHPLIADIVSFKGPHINHLTPATCDIDGIQINMQLNGFNTKKIIEGPPKRKCPILLRQTSFTAIAENVCFSNDQGQKIEGQHTARFGEIEQRGIALTKKGQRLYEKLIRKGNKKSPNYDEELKKIFAVFPDDYSQLRSEKLAYFNYQINKHSLNINDHKSKDINELIASDVVVFEPILYEDFLPVSAAGIFHSNLNQSNIETHQENGNQSLFEKDLGCPVLNPFTLYADQENQSIKNCLDYFTNPQH